MALYNPRRSLAFPGAFWRPSGVPWRSLAFSGAPSGVPWRSVAHPGAPCRSLALSGACWRFLALPGAPWHFSPGWTQRSEISVFSFLGLVFYSADRFLTSSNFYQNFIKYIENITYIYKIAKKLKNVKNQSAELNISPQKSKN